MTKQQNRPVPSDDLVREWLCEYHGVDEDHWLAQVSELERFLAGRAAAWAAGLQER